MYIIISRKEPQYILNSTYLHINKANSDHSGLYACVVKIKNTHLSSSPMLLSIVVVEKLVSANVYSQISLSCNFASVLSSFHKNTYQVWLKDGQVLRNISLDWRDWLWSIENSSAENFDIDNLVISELRSENLGIYECVVHHYETNQKWLMSRVRVEFAGTLMNYILYNKFFWITMVLAAIIYIYVSHHVFREERQIIRRKSMMVIEQIKEENYF